MDNLHMILVKLTKIGSICIRKLPEFVLSLGTKKWILDL